jgi:death-on-curing protein
MAAKWYPDMQDVLAVHQRQLERFGEAAALWESLTMNHGFIDGNKRVGLAMTDVFLRINGRNLSATSDETLSFVIGSLEAKSFEKNLLEAWLRRHTRSAG